MTTDRESGTRNLVFHCDLCTEYLETETDDFSIALNVLYYQKWEAIKIGADWHHCCPECDITKLGGMNATR